MSTIDNEYQLDAWQPPYRPDNIIEDNLLLPETTMMLFGSAGSWKTMNALHLAYCLAQGKSWFGMQTRPATIFYHQEELPKYLFKERYIKYRIGNSASSKNIFFQTPADDIILDTTFGMQMLDKNLEEVRRRAANPELPLVIVLDPLYNYMAGHISDEYEVKKFQHNVNALRKKYALTVIVIHHARLTRTDTTGNIVDLGLEEIMGSSYWNNWLDTVVRVRLTNPYAGSDQVAVDFAKHRNAQHFHVGFRVKWNRANLVPEVIERDIIEGNELSVRGLT